MGATLQFIGDWGHALAAALFAAVGIYLLRRRTEAAELRLLAVAALVTSCWALYVSFGGVSTPLSGIGESVRNAAWLLAMLFLLRRGPVGRTSTIGAVVAVYAAVAGMILLQSFIDVSWHQIAVDRDVHRALMAVSLILRMLTAIGCLLLVHQLYAAWPARERGGMPLLLGALAAMWTYDLNLYTLSYVVPDRVDELYALRGLLMAVLAPVMAAGLRKDIATRVQFSRALTFHSLSVVAIALYMILLVAAVILVELIAGPYARLIEIGAVFFASVSAMVLLPSRQVRAFWKVQVAKHFFQHRYDYRAEWMRFGETIGRPGTDAAPLGQRVSKAVADITESPAAILFLRDDSGACAFETDWNWGAGLPDGAHLPADLARRMEEGWIIDLGRAESRSLVPDWLDHEPRAWALTPLIHYGRLIGVILLARPPIDRRLDWEDFDMLRAAGRQAATYISEAQGQQALDDARRFDEFNRRFAFIIHDVKNLVSQLSLLARNAERHADNPQFRADMVLTLKESVGKMNDMLARLSQHNKARPEEPRPLDVRALVAHVARSRGRHHPVEIEGDAPRAMADPVRTEQIVTHLLQNAIDASPAGSPVVLRLSADGPDAVLDIIDKGTGMSAEFVRRDLFKPFSSSKAGGFGLGAFEARSLAEAMGGRVEVESKPGAGTRFTVRLPRAPSAAITPDRQEEAA